MGQTGLGVRVGGGDKECTMDVFILRCQLDIQVVMPNRQLEAQIWILNKSQLEIHILQSSAYVLSLIP